jgi:hypothetical protein
MPLDQVVDVLGSGRNDLVRVLAGCWLLDNPLRDNPLRAEMLRQYATKLLGENEMARLNFQVALRGSISFSPPPGDLSTQDTRLAYACNTLLGNAACKPSNHQLGAWLDLGTLVTSIKASVDVNRPPGAFHQHADPRGWQTDVPLFFKTSEMCDLVNGDFETRANPSRFGDTNYHGLLLEHVSVGFAPGLPIDCINVLDVDCKSHNPDPRFRVSLHACLETMLTPSWSRGGLDVDSGEFSATPVNGGTTRLVGTKVARFGERELLGQPIGRQLNYFAPFCLAGLMSILIFGGACAL